jgi:uncharacterized heparinase superfamily protein
MKMFFDKKKDAMRWNAFYRTVRYTRLSQLLWRIRYQLERRRKVGAHVAARWCWPKKCPPRLRDDFPDLPVLHTPENHAEAVGELARGEFRFLNQDRSLGRECPDWRLGAVAAERLWTITLHYHAWAYDLARAATKGADGEEAAALFRHYLSDWISRCTLETPGARDLAWNAYAIATRLTWWIRSHRLLRSQGRDGSPLEQHFLSSLWQQAAYLRDHLEWDLRGNHLMRDAVGLAWAGRFFDEDRARDWLKTATRLAVEQAEEQILPDGGHFERSPMYHLHVMEDVLSLALLVEDPQAREHLRETWRRMAEYLCWLRHPDGDIALFNDGGLLGATVVEVMLHSGQRLGVRIDLKPRRGGAFFPDTGMVVWHGEPWTIFFDVGAVGPDYQPGHAHADTLSIECSFQGRRLFVDAGTYAYDLDERRRYDRSTAAHNTVCLDGQDSSEVWHIFRVGRRAYPLDVEVDFSEGRLQAAASHTGYDHLPGQPRHRRRLALEADKRLVITDNIVGQRQHRLEGGFLLAPEWTAAPAAGGWMLRNGESSVRLIVQSAEKLQRYEERRAYHPRYGCEVEWTRLSWRLEDELPAEVVAVVERV